MAQVEQQLSLIQEQIKKYAEQLGQLNLINNQLMENNQLLSSEIVNINNKINKKKQKIEQENKDKQIIHQKLVKAEKIKEQVQIAKSSDNNQKQKERRAKLQQQRLRQQQQYAKEQERIKMEQLLKQAQQKLQKKPIKVEQQITKKEIVKQQQPIKQSKIVQPTAAKKQQKETKVQSIPATSSIYNNFQKGQYKPPSLFFDDDEDDDDEDDEDNSKMLQILRSKLKMQSRQLHDNEDDD